MISSTSTFLFVYRIKKKATPIANKYYYTIKEITAHHQRDRPERLHPVDGRRCRFPQPNTRQSSGSSVEEEGRIRGTRGFRDTMRTQPTKSTNWDSWGLSENREAVGV